MRTTRKFSVCLLAVSASCAGLLFLFGNSVWSKEPGKANARVKELQGKRLAILEEIRDSTKQLYTNARLSYEEVYAAQVELLTARIAYADTQKERIQACDEAFKEATAWQELVRARVEASQASRVEELKAKAFLLETQIAREKAAAGE